MKKQIIKENIIDVIIDDIIEETIKKRGDKFCLISKKSGRNLGCYPSRKGAEKREKQVQYFKHIKEMSSMSSGTIQMSPATKTEISKEEENK